MKKKKVKIADYLPAVLPGLLSVAFGVALILISWSKEKSIGQIVLIGSILLLGVAFIGLGVKATRNGLGAN